MDKKLTILIAFTFIIIGFVFASKVGWINAQFIWTISNEGRWLLPLIGISALIDSINPCAFSILILTIAFLFSVGQLRSRILQIGGVYIFGIFLAYILIGLGLLHAFHLFNTPQFMGKLGALLLIILGSINLINEFNPSFPVKLKIPASAHHKMAQLMNKGSMLAAFGLGALVGICEFPCTGGPYLMVLGLLHDQGTYLKGLGYLLIYNLIFILPLVVILLLSGNEKITKRIQIWQGQERGLMRFGGGLAMVALGALILLI
ncbi:MAG: cytochrome c biogenesis protein CcdA [bacterium]|nr:cytochrome c biogenesis protein CcdA [bacterium]